MNECRGYVDLQVNGYFGVDFNADRLDGEAVEIACQQMLDDGVAGILATVITDDVEVMTQRLANIVRIRNELPVAKRVIWGIHIEGPFLRQEPGYVGAHIPRHTRPADLETLRPMLDAAEGLTRIVTLAPEADAGNRVVRWLADEGICASAGHCNPSLDQLRAAIDAGLSMFTHLGNGCPLEMHRHDNIIQRVLSVSDRLCIGFIADGVHIPFHALRNYLNLVGTDRAFIVTDAITAAGRGPGTYIVGNRPVVVDEQLATWVEDKSHLFGSAMTMPAAVENLRRELELDAQSIAHLTDRNPRRAIGADAEDRS